MIANGSAEVKNPRISRQSNLSRKVSQVMASKINIFISYSHRDKRWLNKVKVHLAPLIRNGNLSAWSDADLKIGTKWRSEIQNALDSANCAILLVSPDFLASEFIMSDELPSILRQHEEGGLWVVLVFVRHALYQPTPLGSFQGANNPRAPLASLTTNKQDEVMSEIAKELDTRIRSLGAQIETGEINSSVRSSTSSTRLSEYHPEKFCTVSGFNKLQKIGHWLYDDSEDQIVGGGMHSYLLSGREYKLKNLKVRAVVSFKNRSYYAIEGVKEFNAAIVFGWQHQLESPSYYNLVFSGDDIWFERIGYRQGDTIRDFEHLSVSKPFTVTEGSEIVVELVFSETHCGVVINGETILSQVIPQEFSGKIGIRPWRSQVNISQFDILAM